MERGCYDINDNAFRKSMNEGFLYCFSNESMPGLLKIGMTTRTPEERLAEANTTDTWRPPTPYKIEFAKFVNFSKFKEATVHRILYRERVHPCREFFRSTLKEIKLLFDLMDEVEIEPVQSDVETGEGANDRTIDEANDRTIERVTEPRETHHDSFEPKETCEIMEQSRTESEDVKTKKKRDMKEYFTSGQQIRHKVGVNKYWIGEYHAISNSISCRNTLYKTLTAFARAHYKAEIPERSSSVNGWKECEYKHGPVWITTANLF
jgi:hypothetical protein